MNREDLKLIPLAAVGLTIGAINVFIRPAVSSFIERTFQMPDMDEVNKYIAEIALDTFEE